MSHKFQVQNKSKLDSPKRREFLNPEKILAMIGLKNGEYLLDVGCGIGYFSIPAAKIVGNLGIICGLDTEPEMLQEVKKRAETEKLDNISLVINQEYSFPIKENIADKCLVSLVLHEIEEKEVFLLECKKALKEKGTIHIIEWKKEDSDWGPPKDHRVSEELIEEDLKKCGYKEIVTTELNQYYYLTTARK